MYTKLRSKWLWAHLRVGWIRKTPVKDLKHNAMFLEKEIGFMGFGWGRD